MKSSNLTLVDALQQTAARAPQRGITVFDRRGQIGERRTFADLLRCAELSAGRLAGAGILPGDRVLVCLPTSWDLLEIWFGMLLRGAHAVLVAPSGAMGGGAAHGQKLANLVETLKPRKLICDHSTQKGLLAANLSVAAERVLLPETLRAVTPAANARGPAPAPDDIAFLQLTSGSTGRQRAVMIRHSNILHNADAIRRFSRAIPFDPADRVVSWLPLNHDMGLVGGPLYSVINGFDLFLLRPDTFLARPRLWLHTISQNRATMSPGPNFAYQLCCERISDADLAGLDLSTWRAAMTGAEMVQPATCSAFISKMAARGFRPEQLVPCYGMAETTLAACADVKRQGPRARGVPNASAGQANTSDVVCVGAPVADTTVRICEAGSPGTDVGEERVGEILISGPGVFAGYYNDPEATADGLCDIDGRRWLRTGDLGFLSGGELYITGRTKELLIIHGHNIMPHELEWIAEAVSGGGGTERCGAFSVPGGVEGERAVLVLEINAANPSALPAMDHEIRTRIARTLGLPLADLVFVKRGQIPKTTSGKVQRHQLRGRYMDGQLERLGAHTDAQK